MAAPKIPFYDDDYVKPAYAARFLGLSVEVLRNRANDGRIAFEKTITGQRLYRLGELRRYKAAMDAAKAEEEEERKRIREGIAKSDAGLGTLPGKLYTDEGRSIRELAISYGVPWSTMRNHLLILGVKFRGAGHNRFTKM